MKITFIKHPKVINTPREPIKPKDVFPGGRLRPDGVRSPLTEYSIMGRIIAGLNGYTGYG
jgi:hypothetical protein